MSATAAAASVGGDDALLVLIHQHLRSRGFLKAAEVLEKHVPQVETTHDCSSLHEIYTSWMKFCSVTQYAKQDPKDSDTLKKNGIEPETADAGEGGEECAEAPNITEDNEDDVKASLDFGAGHVESTCTGAEGEDVSEQLPEAAGEGAATSNSEVELLDGEGEEMTTEKEEAPSRVSAEAESRVAAQVTRIDPAQDPPQDAEQAEPCGSDSERREETNRDDDEPEQEPEETVEPTETSAVTAETSEGQTEVPAFCCQDEEDEEDEEDGAAERLDSAEPASPHPTPPEPDEEPFEHEAPPPAELESESREKEELEQMEIFKDSVDTPPQKPEGQVTLTDDPHSTDAVTVAAAAERADMMVLNIRGEGGDAAERETSQLLPEADERSCSKSNSPKKKKKRRSKTETAADTRARDTSVEETPSDAPLSSSSSKKKKRDKTRLEEVVEEETSPSEKKVGKKRKQERNEVEEESVETPVVHSEKKKKEKEERCGE